MMVENKNLLHLVEERLKAVVEDYGQKYEDLIGKDQEQEKYYEGAIDGLYLALSVVKMACLIHATQAIKEGRG